MTILPKLQTHNTKMIENNHQQIQMQQAPKQQQKYYQLKKLVINSSNIPKNLTCLHLHNDVMYLGTRQSKLYIYRMEGEALVDEKVIIPHCEIVSSIASDQKYFVTVAESDDQMPVSIWEVKTRMFITALKSHQSQVSKVIFLSEPGWLATSSWDCTVKIWDLRDILSWEQNVKTIKSEYPVLVVSQISEDVIAFGGDDCYINFWNWRNMEYLGKFFGHAGSVTLIYSVSEYILTAGGDHRLKEWNINTLGASKSAIKAELDKDKQAVQGQHNKQLVQVSKQVKKKYDSSIFLARINSKDVLLLDRHGNRFIHRFGYDFISCANNFKYNENITGMVNYQGRIYVTTTKGELLCFQIDLEKSPFGGL